MPTEECRATLEQMTSTAFVFGFIEAVHALPGPVFAQHFTETARYFDEFGPLDSKCVRALHFPLSFSACDVTSCPLQHRSPMNFLYHPHRRSFKDLAEMFLVMLGTENMQAAEHWLRRARLWRFIFLQDPSGYFDAQQGAEGQWGLAAGLLRNTID